MMLICRMPQPRGGASLAPGVMAMIVLQTMWPNTVEFTCPAHPDFLPSILPNARVTGYWSIKSIYCGMHLHIPNNGIPYVELGVYPANWGLTIPADIDGAE